MRGIDERARALLERTEALTAADMARLHGTVRDRKPELGFIQVGGGTPRSATASASAPSARPTSWTSSSRTRSR